VIVDCAQEGLLGSTIREVQELPFIQILEHMSYLQDLAKVEKSRNEGYVRKG
jgi:hypothetical protein